MTGRGRRASGAAGQVSNGRGVAPCAAGLRIHTSLCRKVFLKETLQAKRTALRPEPKQSCQMHASIEPGICAKVQGVKLSSLFFLEIFSGTGVLCAAVRRLSMPHSFGVDCAIHRLVKSPTVKLDLTTEDGQQLLWEFLSHPGLVAVHMGPPMWHVITCA